MSGFKLHPVSPGETFHRIYSGKRWVGRVWQHAVTRRWHGRIGDHEAEGTTAVAAFREVAAKALGFPDLLSLLASNAAVRRDNKRRNANARAVASAMMSPDRAVREAGFEAFFQVLSGKKL